MKIINKLLGKDVMKEQWGDRDNIEFNSIHGDESCKECGAMMLTKDNLDHIKEITTNIYDKACEEIGYSNIDSVNALTHDLISTAEYDERFEKLDDTYRKMLCGLSSKILQDVITAEKCGQQRRAKKTLDTIATELLERELNLNGNS